MSLVALVAVLSLLGRVGRDTVPATTSSPTATIATTATPSLVITVASPSPLKTSGPSTLVYCGMLSTYTAPTASSGGAIAIERPGDRHGRGGPVVFSIPSGQQVTAPAGWTCVRLIPAVPAAAFVGLVPPGSDGYFAQPSPTPRGEYANPALLYYLTLPEPYRLSDVLKSDNMGPDVASGSLPATGEAFTARTKADENALAGQRCETACPIWSYVVSVDMFTDLSSPRQWYAKRGAVAAETIEDFTIDGRAAIKVTGAEKYPVQIIINDHTWMLRVAYQIYSTDAALTSAGVSKAKLDLILASFHFTQ